MIMIETRRRDSKDILLNKYNQGLDVAIRNLSQTPPEHAQEIQHELAQLSPDGRQTVPNIFVHGKSIGGNAELQELYHSDQLEGLLFPQIAPDDTQYRAIYKGVVLAKSESTVVVRGYSYYFPPHSLVNPDKYLVESKNYTSHCGWKGEANHWHIRIPNKNKAAKGSSSKSRHVYKNAVWTFRDPLPEAQHFKDFYGFEPDILIMKGREMMRTNLFSTSSS